MPKLAICFLHYKSRPQLDAELSKRKLTFSDEPLGYRLAKCWSGGRAASGDDQCAKIPPKLLSLQGEILPTRFVCGLFVRWHSLARNGLVIGRLFGNEHTVRMALDQPGVGNTHEAGLLPQLL